MSAEFYRGDVFWPALAAVLAGCIVGFALFMSPSAPDYKAKCERYTIAWSGLRACYDDGGCHLGDAELYDMYKFNKKAIMSCSRYTAEQVIIQLNKDEEGIHASN